MFATPVSSAMICCVRSAISAASSVGKCESLIVRIGVQRLRAAEHAGEGLDRDAGNVVQRLLNGQRNAGGLRVKTHLHRPRILRTEAFLHRPRPDDAGGAIFGDLFKEIVVGVEEERQPRDEFINIHPAINAVLHILDAVTQREGELLQRGRTGLADVVAGDRRSGCISERVSSQYSNVSMTSFIAGLIG